MSTRGFTLIELMVVISIMGILTVMGFAVFTNTQKSARDGKRIADIQEIQKALEQYYSLNQDYPNTIDSDINNFYSNFQDSTPPKDATSSASYNYTYCASSKKYILCAGLENCTNKCNRGALPSDACSQTASDSNIPKLYHCVSSLTN